MDVDLKKASSRQPTKGTFQTLPQMIRTEFDDGTTIEGPADLPVASVKDWIGPVIDGFCKITGLCGGGGGGSGGGGCTSTTVKTTASDGSTTEITVKTCPAKA